VIVDEASMVDLPMMAQLMESLGDHTKLILLGDKDQLASVEAGSVLGDLCDSGIMINGYHAHGLEEKRAMQLELLCGLNTGYLNDYIEGKAPLMANSLTQLRVSYRFTSDSGIGRLAEAVNAGRYDLVISSFSEYSDIQSYAALNSSKHVFDVSKLADMNAEKAELAWQQQVIDGYGYYLKAIEGIESPETVLELFNRFQLLCALRQGNSGLLALNERIQMLLQSCGLLKLDFDMNSATQQRWFPGRPVMISRNDYELNLFNGDIGIAMMVAGTQGDDKELRVCFIADGKIRQILPTRLPEHETAFAMTVHKSQGSEFTDVALVLPENYSPVISRELIYTAITRAKSSFSLYSNADILEKGVSSRIERASGLRDLLFKSLGI
jgi:exodeoxyribonuclease V alpha subunit